MPSAILTVIVAVAILLLVATAMVTFSAPLQRLTHRVLGDEDDDDEERHGRAERATIDEVDSGDSRG